MAASSAPVLDLTTDQIRSIVNIDRLPYDIRTPSDLTLAQFQRLERLVPRAGELMVADDLANDEAAELSVIVDAVCRIALDAPADLIDRLGDLNKVQIFKIFAELLSPRLLQARANLVASVSTGTKPSRGSSASTGATLSRGSRTRRSA